MIFCFFCSTYLTTKMLLLFVPEITILDSVLEEYEKWIGLLLWRNTIVHCTSVLFPCHTVSWRLKTLLKLLKAALSIPLASPGLVYNKKYSLWVGVCIPCKSNLLDGFCGLQKEFKIELINMMSSTSVCFTGQTEI